MCSCIVSAIVYTFSVLLRQLRLFGCATTPRLVLSITHWGTRRFWSHAFASRIFLPLLTLLMLSSTPVCFPAHDKRLLVMRGEQRCRIEPAGPDRIPDLCFVIAVLDRAGLPVLYDKELVCQPVDFAPDIAEQGTHVRAPCPAAKTLDRFAREHRDPVVEPCAVPDHFILCCERFHCSLVDCVDGIVRIPLGNYQVGHFVQHSFLKYPFFQGITQCFSRCLHSRDMAERV